MTPNLAIFAIITSLMGLFVRFCPSGFTLECGLDSCWNVLLTWHDRFLLEAVAMAEITLSMDIKGF